MREYAKYDQWEERDSAEGDRCHTKYLPSEPRYLTETEAAEYGEGTSYCTKTEYDANGDPVVRTDWAGRRVVYLREAEGKRTFVIYSGY
jgi:hypothetical protein